jgi:hypothetical protein
MRQSNSSTRFLSTRRARRRGTASVEAVIALPVLILLLFGVMYVSRAITARHQADDLARSCAWRYSANGCDSVPDGCSGIVSRGTRDDSAAEDLKASWGDAIDMASKFESGGGGFKGLIAQVVGSVFGDTVMKALMKDAKSAVKYAVSREGPAGTTEELLARYQLPCNLKERSVAELAKQAWKDAISSRF